MRLFLSSYRAGGHEQRLVETFGVGSRVGLITNAKDDKTDAERKESVHDVLQFLRDLRFVAEELDLRDYFDEQPSWHQRLSGYDALWVAGGNTFVLRRALGQSGLFAAVRPLIRSGKLRYGGESAGAILATPSLVGVEHGDDPLVRPPGYIGDSPLNGLGMVEYCIVPHYGSEWGGATEMADALRTERKLFRTLTDKQAMMVHGDRQELIG